jgi:pyruvate/2-oxoacid:ferredoxin oxidoreductase beta subunit/Pyruvate/2-oxoacid:ferredoxin oxidoreductase gamma subunit
MTATVTPLGTYRNERPYPFCPGCGHGPILDHLDSALVAMQLDPAEVVLVSDIGCSGLSDQYFATSAFHGLHGRSITYAAGIKLANPELTVIVIMGDGGTGIGGTHLISAARRNVGITVLVMNNLNFGMTGGQHSTTTTYGAVTSTTPAGNLEHPLDICATVGVNGAGYVYRGTSFDPDLSDRIVAAVRHPGFALLDVWDLCTAYFVRSNRFSRRTMSDVMAGQGLEAGLLYEREVEDYGAAYRAAADSVKAPDPPRTVPVTHSSRLERRFVLNVAGSAGAKVGSAARLIGEGAIRSGLWVAQTNDYPVTVKTGHSRSQLVMGPDPEPILPVARPDAVVLVSADGYATMRDVIAGLADDATLFTTPEFATVATPARVAIVDPADAPSRLPRTSLALYVATRAVADLELYPVAALREAAAAGRFAEQSLVVVDAAARTG